MERIRVSSPFIDVLEYGGTRVGRSRMSECDPSRLALYFPQFQSLGWKLAQQICSLNQHTFSLSLQVTDISIHEDHEMKLDDVISARRPYAYLSPMLEWARWSARKAQSSIQTRHGKCGYLKRPKMEMHSRYRFVSDGRWGLKPWGSTQAEGSIIINIGEVGS